MKDETKLHLIYVAITCLALLFCLAVASQNRGLAQELAGHGGGNLSGAFEAIPGDILPPFQAEDEMGKLRTLTYQGAEADADSAPQRLFFIYSKSCGICDLQRVDWRELLEEVERISPETEAVALLVTGEEETEPIAEDLLTLTLPDLGVQRGYRVSGVPMTLLVSPQGRLLWSRYGRFEPPEFRGLLELFERRR